MVSKSDKGVVVHLKEKGIIMGCFSFMCKECNKAVLSNSFSGEKVRLFLLEGGKVIQEMEGDYDSYGRVFIDGSQDESVSHNLRKNAEWDKEWSDVCDLMFSSSKSDGMAAIHSKCFVDTPKTRSEDDPMQGWGDDGELMDNIDDVYFESD